MFSFVVKIIVKPKTSTKLQNTKVEVPLKGKVHVSRFNIQRYFLFEVQIQTHIAYIQTKFIWTNLYLVLQFGF